MKVRKTVFIAAFFIGIFCFDGLFNTALAQDKASCPTVELSGTHISCPGGADGTLSLSVSNGSGSYTIEWSSGETGAYSLSNKTAGIYSVEVKDNATGCVVFNPITLTQPDKLTADLTVTDAACFEEASGKITTDISGGTANYSYSWNGGAYASEDLNDVPAGDYSLLVTDANGCQVTANAAVNQPAQPLGLSARVQEVLCTDDSNGSIDVDVWGGTSPYYYNWNGNSYNSQDIKDISSGTYDLTVTDAKGCVLQESFHLDNPEPMQMTASVSQNFCYGIPEADIHLNVTGGTGSYEYTWSNTAYVLGFETATIENLPNSRYFVTVNDENNCKINDEFLITSPDEIILDINTVDVSSSGGSDGQIELSVSGGIEPYSFGWSNGTSTQNNSDVPAGLYEVLVRDANNCTVETSVYINEPAEPLSFTYIKQDVSCYGASDGQIFAYPKGGQEPYSFSWSAGSSESYLNGISAGNYILTLTDANDITYRDTIAIGQPEPISFVHTAKQPTCNSFSNGNIELEVNGGTKPYSFHWYDSDFALAGINKVLTHVKAGYYTVQVEDSMGCKANYAVEVDQPEPLKLSSEEDQVQCAGGSSGSIHTTVTGGTQPYSYNWTNGETGPDALNLRAGDHRLTVTDANGCLIQLEAYISEADPIEINMYPEDVSCVDQTDGIINTSVKGGNGGFTYEWSTGETQDAISGLSPGEYTLSVTDILGCKNSETAEVGQNNVACLFIPTVFTPNADGINDRWIIENIEVYPNCLMQIFNKWGNLIYESKGYSEAWDGTYNGSELPSGSYFYVLSFSDNLEVRKGTVTIVK
jgi:gliding motility-associated-like protein